MEPSNSNSQKKEEDSAIPDHILANLAEYLLKLNSALKEAPLSPDVSDGLLALSLSSPINAPQSQNGIQHADTNNVANATTASSIKVELDFLDVFSDSYLSLADYLDKINFEASQAGYKYNRGPTDLTRGYYSIYCKYKPRRLPKESEINASKTRKRNPCEVYYRLRLVGRELKLVAFEQSHNHEGTDFSDITESMKLDLKLICRTRNILDIIDYLESKYRCNGLNYYKVYYQFRKIQPLFRERDCATFVSFLHLKNCFTKYVLVDEDENLCKLFFATPQMISNYSLYGDIVIADTTYQVNRYKIPLLIFTGVARNGKNVVFGMACINDETYETYKWALEAFYECHKKVYPKTIVTDGDLSLCGAADDYKNQSVHLVCQWHMNRNITRRFAFLKKINMDLYTLVIGLSHEKDQNQAENHFNKLEEFLKTSKAYDKSLKYLQKIWAYKQKWVDPYMPQIFTGGVTTTSRTEAMNALVKRYTTKTSEISAMIELIDDLDASFAFNDPNSLKEKKPIDAKIPMLQGLQENLGDIIYKKHYEEYLLSHQYLWFGLPDEVDTYQITYDGHLQEPELHSRKVVWKDNQIICSCNFYPTTGIICRHLFVIARKNQAVDLAKFIHPRWKINRNEDEMQIETPFFEKKEVDTIRREEKARMAKEEQEMESVLDFTRILSAKRKRGQKPKMKHSEVEVSDDSQEDDDEGEEEEEEEHKTSDLGESNGQSPKSASGKKKKVLKNFKPLLKTKGRPSKTDSKKRKERETDELSDLYQTKKPFKK